MRRIYEDILDDIEQIKRPDISIEDELWTPSPGAYDYAMCCYIHEEDLKYEFEYKLPYFLDIYADDYSYYLAKGVEEQRRIYSYINNLDMAVDGKGAFVIIEFTADKKKLPYLVFYLFGIARTTCYYLYQDEKNPLKYRNWSYFDNRGSGQYARDILNKRYVTPNYRRVLYTQIACFIMKYNFTGTSSEDYKKIEQTSCDVVERLFQRYQNIKAKEAIGFRYEP